MYKGIDITDLCFKVFGVVVGLFMVVGSIYNAYNNVFLDLVVFVAGVFLLVFDSIDTYRVMKKHYDMKWEEFLELLGGFPIIYTVIFVLTAGGSVYVFLYFYGVSLVLAITMAIAYIFISLFVSVTLGLLIEEKIYNKP